MLFKNHTLNAFLDPKNIFVTLINVLIFLTVQTIFIWVTGSKTLEYLIRDNEQIIVDYYEKDNTARTTFCKNQIDQKSSHDDQLSEINAKNKEAEEKNLDLIKEKLLPFWLVLLVICVICFSLSIKRFSLIDLVTLGAVFAAFATEAFYYFVVFRNTQFFGKFEIIAEIDDPGSTEDIWCPIANIYHTYEKTQKNGADYYIKTSAT